ncbi:MAG TPA: xylose isomerase [Solirubrobacteraceae bacterium]|nr:xylose isomerase [Solirubrobacteraceae bacterium]
MSVHEMDLTPRPEHRFTFGLWTVGNPGRDPFGEPTRPPLDPVTSVERLAELGAYGVSLHDNDLVPYGSSAAERDRIVARFADALQRTGLRVTMATTNLFGHPAFKDGAFTSNDRAVRRAAIAKAMRGIDLGAELGAEVYVFWGGREGAESAASKRVGDALERYREAINFLSAYVRDQGYGMRFAIEPKPNEPRGDIFLPTVGHALHFITTLDHSEMVGVNPEVAHETMAGLSFVHAVAQALWAGKLFHIDLNAQRIGRYDQDFRFGAEDLKEAFLLVHLLETSGYQGVRHFDAHAYRSEDPDGVWDFAAGCMRTYLTLAAKSRQFLASDAIRAAREAARVDELAEPSVGAYSSAAASALLKEDHDLDALAGHGYGVERLDQLVVDLLLGAG